MNKKTSYINSAGLMEFMYLHSNNNDLFLSHCGMQQCNPGHFYGYIPRPEYHLHFILDGQGTLNIFNSEYHLSRGQIFVIPPGIRDYYYSANQEHPWYYAWVAFSGTLAQSYMEKAGFSGSSVIRSSCLPPEEYTSYIYDMLQNKQISISNDFDRTGNLYLLLAKLIETSASATDAYHYSAENYIQYALQYIQFNYNRNIQINDIVQYININRSYFSRIFKENMGISPKDYLKQYRMKQATILLKETSYSIELIANQVGYKDPFSFSKTFKNHCGISPSNYRSLHSNTRIL